MGGTWEHDDNDDDNDEQIDASAISISQSSSTFQVLGDNIGSKHFGIGKVGAQERLKHKGLQFSRYIEGLSAL